MAEALSMTKRAVGMTYMVKRASYVWIDIVVE